MNKKMRSVVALVMCMAVMLSWALPAGAQASLDQPAHSNNMGAHEYTYDRWANPIESYLIPNADGTLTRVEFIGQTIVVEEYTSDFEFISGRTIEPELPLFGGFYFGSTHNFFVFGQMNDAEDDSVEVIRVVCYTKDWQRVGSDSLYGANTTTPFRAGSLRFAECNGYLYIRTAHEMYTSADGLRHQANVMINFRIADTTITDSFSRVMNNNYGYVSHSFNQFLAVDGTDLLAVDHGDAYPRAIALFLYHAPAGQDSFMQGKYENGRYSFVKQVNVLNIQGQIGLNDTGVALGGFQVSAEAYLIAGNTVSQEPGCDLFGQRNIFITVTSKTDFSENGTTIRYLTNFHENAGVQVSNPYFVKVEEGKYILLWTETVAGVETLRFCFVDGLGQMLGQIHTAEGILSDCEPVVAGDQLIWYATSASGPAFFTIDLNNPENSSHQHIYRFDYASFPRYAYAGELSSHCAICMEAGPSVEIPPLKDTEAYTLMYYAEEPTCTRDGYGYFRWNDTGLYNVADYRYGYAVPALGHDWVEGDCQSGKTCGRCGEVQPGGGHDWRPATCLEPETCVTCGQTRGEPTGHNLETGIVTKNPTCTETGEIRLTCGCGYYETEELGAWGHDYHVSMTAPDCTNPGYTTRTCSRCDDCETEEIAALGHQYDSEVTIPDCTNPGYTIHTCVRCGDCYRTHETLPTGHRYDLGTIISEATCHQEGVRLYQCINCDASYEETIEKVPHFYEEQITPPTCENDGASCYVCGVCGATESGAVYPALGHEYVGQRIPATETEGGYTIYTCLNCGDSYVENETPPLGIVISGTITSFLTEDAVTVELLLDGQVIGSQTLSGENCDYSFRVTERGNYTLRVTKKNHVTMEYNLSTENEHVSLDVKLCPVGDVTGDGGVNVKDFQRLLRHINKTNLLSEDELAWADVTGDGVVNVKDFQRLLRHINKTNPLF